jgi:hypothetical protein
MMKTVCKEQSASEHLPHMTLGFVFIFAQDNTHKIQRPYKVLHRIVFDALTNKTNTRNV